MARWPMSRSAGCFSAASSPASWSALALMSVVYCQSRNSRAIPRCRRRGPLRLRAALRALVDVWAALLAPLIIVGGILGGIFTATEAGVVACVYSFLIAVFVYRTIRLRDLPQILLGGADHRMVAGIIGIAGSFGWLLAYLNFNQLVLARSWRSPTAAAAGLPAADRHHAGADHVRRFDGGADHRRADRGLYRPHVRHRPVPARRATGHGDPDRRDHAAGRGAAVRRLQHRAMSVFARRCNTPGASSPPKFLSSCWSSFSSRWRAPYRPGPSRRSAGQLPR